MSIKLKICFAITHIIFFAGSLHAQSANSADWAVEAFNRYAVEPNITYKTVNGIDLKLDVYRLKGKPEPRPTLVFIHGGGWNSGTKEGYSLRILPWMEMGWTVVNVEYRVMKDGLAPAAVQDCRCALRWLYANADRYRVDKTKIVVSGQSAGGHLALITGMLTSKDGLDNECAGGEEPKVAAIINWFGISDINDLLSGTNKKGYATGWIGERPDKEEIARRISPISKVRSGLPPIFTVHGDADPTVPYQQSVKLHEALGKVNVPNQLVTIPKGKHGEFTDNESLQIYAAIKEFLKKNDVLK